VKQLTIGTFAKVDPSFMGPLSSLSRRFFSVVLHCMHKAQKSSYDTRKIFVHRRSAVVQLCQRGWEQETPRGLTVAKLT